MEPSSWTTTVILWCPKWSHPVGFWTKVLYAFLKSPMYPACLACHALDLFSLKIRLSWAIFTTSLPSVYVHQEHCHMVNLPSQSTRVPPVSEELGVLHNFIKVQKYFSLLANGSVQLQCLCIDEVALCLALEY